METLNRCQRVAFGVPVGGGASNSAGSFSPPNTQLQSCW
jgi:hypothetical protein